MNPWELVKKSEHSQQRALFAWANCVAMYGFAIAADPCGYVLETRSEIPYPSPPYPVLSLLFAIHNQGHGDAIRGGMAKAEGVKKGVPDIMLPVPFGKYAGLFIELKKASAKPKREGSKGATSADQDDWIPKLRANHYRVEVAYGWLEAAAFICDYLYVSAYTPQPLKG